MEPSKPAPSPGAARACNGAPSTGLPRGHSALAGRHQHCATDPPDPALAPACPLPPRPTVHPTGCGTQQAGKASSPPPARKLTWSGINSPHPLISFHPNHINAPRGEGFPERPPTARTTHVFFVSSPSTPSRVHRRIREQDAPRLSLEADIIPLNISSRKLYLVLP